MYEEWSFANGGRDTFPTSSLSSSFSIISISKCKWILSFLRRFISFLYQRQDCIYEEHSGCLMYCYICACLHTEVSYYLSLRSLCSDVRMKRCSVRISPVVCKRAHVLLMLFVFVCIWRCQIRLDYISIMAGVVYGAETCRLRASGHTPCL